MHEEPETEFLVLGHSIPQLSDDQRVSVIVRLRAAPDWWATLDVLPDGRVVRFELRPFTEQWMTAQSEWLADPGVVDLTSRTLRSFRVEQLRQAAIDLLRGSESREWHHHLAAKAGPQGVGDSAFWDAFVDRWHIDTANDDTANDRALAELAAAYLKCDPRRSLVELREKLAARGVHYSYSRVRDLIHICRERGLLKSRGRGRGGGELTEKALRLLDEEDS